MVATEVLAGALAFLSAKYDELGASNIRSLELDHGRGVEAEVHLPTGDRLLIRVEWLGDREAAS